MLSLIDITIIIKKHYKTMLTDAKLRFILFLFFVIPTIVTILLIYKNKFLTENSVPVLITAFAIFAGFLLNTIVIIFSIVDKIDKNNSIQFEKKKRLLRHLYANSLYALLITTMILIFLILMVILEPYKKYLLLMFFSFIVYFCITHFLFTLLMIFKRLFILLFIPLQEINRSKNINRQINKE